jgi:hypothetical protein
VKRYTTKQRLEKVHVDATGNFIRGYKIKMALSKDSAMCKNKRGITFLNL